MADATFEGAAEPVRARHEVDRQPTEAATPDAGLGASVRPQLRALGKRLGHWRGQLMDDVLGEHASVGPLTGWLLLALFGLVAYLTLTYAQGAFQRGQMAHGADPAGVISVHTGYWTIILVAALALLVGFEPQLRRRWEVLRASIGGRWLGNRSGGLKVLLAYSRWVARFVWRLRGVIWSFLDYVLARAIAPLAGATQKSGLRRLAWGAGVILLVPAAGLLAPPPLGLWAVVSGIVAVFAIVRRWNWIEAERERSQFEVLLWRGERQEARRVGFDQDLRDEALVALTCLFLLIPLGLQQIQVATCRIDACAFTLDGRNELPGGALAQLLAWLGYFGAELAKSVPFVDWSEVFHVANESPIKPRTALGAQVVFGMRATLDLLLLGAILQAMQIAGRQRVQHAAFRAGMLPVLDPITEAQELRRAGDGIEDALGLAAIEQPSIANFQAYDKGRLRQIVGGNGTDFDPIVRKAATAVLARQHAGEETAQFLHDRATNEPDQAMRSWLLTVASGLAPDVDPARLEPNRQRLETLLADVEQEASVRAAAARALGRMEHADATVGQLLERLSDSYATDPVIRAAAALGLAKLGIADAKGPTHELAGSFHPEATGEVRIAAMATAYACARLSPGESPERIADRFDPRVREHVLRAARVQAEPMNSAAAREREPGTRLDQLVRIAPGERPFGATFRMGSPDDDDMASDDERPPRDVTFTYHFAVGRYPVTQEEYTGFCRATGRAWDGKRQPGSHPITNVLWRDAMAYCSWLERITGERYRLPTEAEWEYACRAGTMTRYSFGDDPEQLGDHAWYKANSGGQTHPVGRKLPNPWGLYDMHGHVWEWCADPWHDSYRGGPDDGSAWLAGADLRRRVLRGGSRGDDAPLLRSADRDWLATIYESIGLGFRIARTLPR
jgi:formylglycine-generating enzyme required for sulfatase activity